MLHPAALQASGLKPAAPRSAWLPGVGLQPAALRPTGLNGMGLKAEVAPQPTPLRAVALQPAAARLVASVVAVSQMVGSQVSVPPVAAAQELAPQAAARSSSRSHWARGQDSHVLRDLRRLGTGALRRGSGGTGHTTAGGLKMSAGGRGTWPLQLERRKKSTTGKVKKAGSSKRLELWCMPCGVTSCLRDRQSWCSASECSAGTAASLAAWMSSTEAETSAIMRLFMKVSPKAS
mmetsp:Transcript_78198/g.253219  ORF Transcript_78198/g.253219 Transcript_78198/m.253219 type:complete len:234 (+) Transcript_78198:630-1331(+)